MARSTDIRVVPGGRAALRTRDIARTAETSSASSMYVVDEERSSARERAARRERHERESSRAQRLVDGLTDTVRRHPRLTIALALIITVIVMLYGPTRDWYVSMRSGQDLQTYYAAVAAQNEQLKSELDRLQTREGIEDEARKRGYVDPDETGVVVENLPADELELPDQIVVDYETTWGTKVFDFIFGYTAGHWK